MSELLEKVAQNFEKDLAANMKCTPDNVTMREGAARVHNINDVECTAALLLENMTQAKCEIPKIPHTRDLSPVTAMTLHWIRLAKAEANGKEEPAPIEHGYEIDDCRPNRYPFQTHHLIPKAYIKKHESVAQWLAAKAQNSKLEYDSTYDTDSAENGYCLPFFSTTRDWYDARVASGTVTEGTKQKIANKMMVATGKQIHQGDHTAEDFLEQEKIESAGYLSMTKALLDVIAMRAASHAELCEKCKGKKGKFLPRKEVVEGMHGVSKILKANIDKWKIFVSRVSATYRKDPQRGCTPWKRKK